VWRVGWVAGLGHAWVDRARAGESWGSRERVDNELEGAVR
jgi:hypothetical protein